MTDTPIRIVVADDHQIVRDGLVSLLDALDGLEVVGTAGDGLAAVDVVAGTQPDVVVMDIQMPELDGIEATRRITAESPGVRVVMLTMNEDDDTVLSAIRAAHAGGMVFGARLAGRVAALFAPPSSARTPEAPRAFPDLTEREREVLEHLAAGRSNDAIARQLYVSNKTVRNAVSSIYAKLHAGDRAEAIIKAREAGFGREA